MFWNVAVVWAGWGPDGAVGALDGIENLKSFDENLSLGKLEIAHTHGTRHGSKTKIF